MTETLPQTDKSVHLSRRPVLTLERRRLTQLIGLMLFTPVAIIVVLYQILPPTHDRPLQVAANLISEYGKPQVVRLTNTGDVALQNLRIELNGAYAYFPHAPLAPHDRLDISTEWFMKKTGQHLDPAKTEIRTIHISARLPGNQRAIFNEDIKETADSSSDAAH